MALTKKLQPWSPRLMEDTGETPEVGYVQIAELHYDWLRWVDGRPLGYQRVLDDRVHKLVAEYDAHLVGAILCNRRTDGTLWVMDGQHRTEATRLVGHSVILATIYNGLTPEQEADHYAQSNSVRRGLTQWNHFGARGTGGDPIVAAIVNLCGESGFKVGTADRSLNSIAAVTTLETVYRWPDGPRLLRQTLGLIRTLWPTNVSSRDGVFIAGITRFVYTWDGSYFDQPGDRVDWSRFGTRLSKVTANEVMRKAKELHFEAGLEMSGTTYALALRDIYNGKSNYSARLTGGVVMPRRSGQSHGVPVRKAR